VNPDLDDALKQLPHGPSFRFVDRLTSLDPGKQASAVFQLRGSEAFLEGHFPENPIMPGVLLIEAIAQLGGIIVQTDTEIPALADLRLTAVRAAKILGAAVPGDELEIHAKLEGRMGALAQVDGEVLLGGQLLASARVTLSGTV
jgi:3-hydroxyacyl-[acyl-carrier-protein] dehydratase